LSSTHLARVTLAAVALLISIHAGAISVWAGTLFDSQNTPAPNNDDYSGPWGEPNFRGFLGFGGFAADQVIGVQPSGGTTEYSFRLGALLPEATPAIHIELGFGVGDNFVSAADVYPELDFDAPFPADPAPQSPFYAVIRQSAHLLELSGGDPSGVAGQLAEFSIDVPDLPVSVNSFYSPDQLPAGLPAGAAAFTLRRQTGLAIPEPSSCLLAILAALPLGSSAALRGRHSGRHARAGFNLLKGLLATGMIVATRRQPPPVFASTCSA
jgi:hypothetical protein